MSSNSKLYIIRNSNGSLPDAITSDIALQIAQDLKNDICVNIIGGTGADTAYSHDYDGLYYAAKEFGTTRKYFDIIPTTSKTTLINPTSNAPYGTIKERKEYIRVQFNDTAWTQFTNAYLGTSNESIGLVLSLSDKYTSYFTPTLDGQPATKRYVDDSITSAIGTALNQSY